MYIVLLVQGFNKHQNKSWLYNYLLPSLLDQHFSLWIELVLLSKELFKTNLGCEGQVKCPLQKAGRRCSFYNLRHQAESPKEIIMTGGPLPRLQPCNTYCLCYSSFSSFYTFLKANSLPHICWLCYFGALSPNVEIVLKH